MAENKKILIVDDDPDLVEALKIILTSADYDVISASNGEEGIKMAKAESPHLIILDIMMTKISEGFETARALRGEKSMSEVPIIVLSAVDQNYNFEFKEHVGSEYLPVNKFIEKPVEPKKLINMVKEFIG